MDVFSLDEALLLVDLGVEKQFHDFLLVKSLEMMLKSERDSEKECDFVLAKGEMHVFLPRFEPTFFINFIQNIKNIQLTTDAGVRVAGDNPLEVSFRAVCFVRAIFQFSLFVYSLNFSVNECVISLRGKEKLSRDYTFYTCKFCK